LRPWRATRHRRAGARFKVSILVDACASVDEREERIALDYAENVVGARLERAGA
jgi:nicotinamidase-related amidase